MPDDAFTRKQACVECGELIYINYPGTPMYDKNYPRGGCNEISQRCPHCKTKLVSVRYPDGSTTLRKAFWQ